MVKSIKKHLKGDEYSMAKQESSFKTLFNGKYLSIDKTDDGMYWVATPYGIFFLLEEEFEDFVKDMESFISIRGDQ